MVTHFSFAYMTSQNIIESAVTEPPNYQISNTFNSPSLGRWKNMFPWKLQKIQRRKNCTKLFLSYVQTLWRYSEKQFFELALSHEKFLIFHIFLTNSSTFYDLYKFWFLVENFKLFFIYYFFFFQIKIFFILFSNLKFSDKLKKIEYETWTLFSRIIHVKLEMIVFIFIKKCLFFPTSHKIMLAKIRH